MPNISVINRALMVGQYQQGATMQTIANRFNVTKSAVCKIIHKHRETGDVIDRERTGRPRVTTRREDVNIQTAAARNRGIFGKSIKTKGYCQLWSNLILVR